MAAPVCGLRAVRARRWAVLKVPKPTNVIESPRFSDFVMPSIRDSTAADAPALDEPVSFAIFAISSCLFMWSPWIVDERGRAQAVIRPRSQGVNTKSFESFESFEP